MSVVPAVASARERAAAYVTAMGPAVQGQGGDHHTFRVAAALVRGFALPFEDALEVMRTWNSTCVPPWEERDLLKKLHNAQRYATGAVGAKLHEARPSPRTFDSADEALDAILSVLSDPLDPARTVREMATLGVIAEPDPAGDLRHRQGLVAWMLEEADATLPWKDAPGKRRPDYRRIPREHRRAALLAALGSYLDRVAADLEAEPGTDPSAPPREDRVRWIMDQAAREHFACTPTRGANRDEILFSPAGLDARATPGARDGHRRTDSLPTEGDAVPTRRVVSPCAALPEDPEVLYARQEALEQVRDSLSPLERAVYDEPFSDPLGVVAAKADTTPKTVKSTRNRIRAKARARATAALAEEDRVARGAA
jgi:hypothetical protein